MILGIISSLRFGPVAECPSQSNATTIAVDPQCQDAVLVNLAPEPLYRHQVSSSPSPGKFHANPILRCSIGCLVLTNALESPIPSNHRFT